MDILIALLTTRKIANDLSKIDDPKHPTAYQALLFIDEMIAGAIDNETDGQLTIMECY